MSPPTWAFWRTLKNKHDLNGYVVRFVEKRNLFRFILLLNVIWLFNNTDQSCITDVVIIFACFAPFFLFLFLFFEAPKMCMNGLWHLML